MFCAPESGVESGGLMLITHFSPGRISHRPWAIEGVHRTPTPLSGFHSIGDFVVCLVFQRLRSHLSEACNLTMSVNSGIASQGDLSPEPKGSIRSGEGSEVLPPVSGPASVAPPTSGATHASSRRAFPSVCSLRHSERGDCRSPSLVLCGGYVSGDTHSFQSFIRES